MSDGTRSAAEAAEVARLVHDFCWHYAPTHLTRSEHTLRGYRTALTLYLGWLGDERGVRAGSLSVDDFSSEALEAWLAWLSESRGNSPQTCNVRLSSIRAFCRYASGRDASFALLSTAVSSVPMRKAPRTKVEGLSRDAVRALAHAPGTGTRQGVRDTTIIVTLYATACRVSEMLSMRVAHLRLDRATPHAVVTGKGGKTRVVYLPAKAVAHLRAYLAEFHGGERDSNAYVFWSRNHGPGERPLSADAVTDLLSKHAGAARGACPDMPEKVTPHRLRHARASHWLQDGMSVAQVSLLLGHASIQTTMRYLDVTVEAKAKAMQRVAGISEPDRSWKGGSGADLLRACGLVP